MLTDVAIKALKPKEKIYKVADRDGMYVHVKTKGTLSFRMDYRLNGRRETVIVRQVWTRRTVARPGAREVHRREAGIAEG